VDPGGRGMRARAAVILLLLALAACLDDPVGPGAISVMLEGGAADTLWKGAPGEAMPAMRVRVLDDNGRPVPAAAVQWVVSGKQAALGNVVSQTNAAGEATAVWTLGTNAAEEQRLNVMVQTKRHAMDVVVRAQAIPHVVANLRLHADSVLRVGDTLALQVDAVDPYGNMFSAPDVQAFVNDATLGSLAGAKIVGGPKRGHLIARFVSHSADTYLPLHVTQFVSSIAPVRDTIVFTSLGATLPVSYVVRDDRGRPVADTVAVVSVSDTSVVRLGGVGLVSAARGSASLQLALPPVSATMLLSVDQRIASIALPRDTIRFDALTDTTTIHLDARDSLGFAVYQPTIVVQIQNQQIAEVAPSLVLTAVTPGVTVVTARDPATGVSTSVPIIVHQLVRSINVGPVAFDALGDTVTPAVTPLDRLGSPVAGAALTYSVSDSSVAQFGASGKLHSISQGHTVLTVRDGETGTTDTAGVMVHQRIVSLSLNMHDITFDALQDTSRLSVVGLDRLGALVSDATSRTSYTASANSVTGLDPNGLVHAIGNGSTSVIARSMDGPSDTVRITVRQVARSLTATLSYNKPIVTLPVGSTLPLSCEAYDSNGFAVPSQLIAVSTTSVTVPGGSCGVARVQHSGYDTLVIGSGAGLARVPVTVAVTPLADSPVGQDISTDSAPAPNGPWSPSVVQGPAGQVYLYYAAYSSQPDSTGYLRGDLRRLVRLGGSQFRYDDVVLDHDDDICSPQGQGIENVAIVPRAETPGWRMLYSAGSGACYGWQVFSAVSQDGLTWTKEPGVRLDNGFTSPGAPTLWPVGEGIQVFQLADGTWQLIVGGFERTTPAPVNQWAIAEWRSKDQLNWTYVGPVLTVRDMPAGWQGSVYSPAISQLAPGLWRMLFTADNRADSLNNVSAIWSAVSTDRVHWQLEGELLGESGYNLYYATVIGQQVFFVKRAPDGAQTLGVANLQTP
jgi:hypothetical protein